MVNKSMNGWHDFIEIYIKILCKATTINLNIDRRGTLQKAQIK